MRLLVASSLLLSFFGCEKEKGPVAVPMGFLLEATITPNARTMQRGDTLWLEVDCSDSLLDRHSGRRFRVRPQDAAFTYTILYKKLLGVDQQYVGVANTFRLVERIGKASINGAFTGGFEPMYDGHYYRAKLGLIPTQAGVTAISMLITPVGGAKALGSFIPFVQLPPDAQGREQKATFDESF